MTLRTGSLVIAAVLVPPGSLCADDWMTWASTYTHEPTTGQRIDQYALPEQPLGPSRSAVRRSGLRHYRSTLQAGQSSDNMHIVEKWGEQVIPYEQWRFPYRPYAVPYDAWGPQAPYGIFNGQAGYGYGGAAHPGYNHPPAGQPTAPGTGYGPGSRYGQQRGFPLQPEYRNQPWYDGNYPSAPPLDPRSDQDFHYHPPLGRPAQDK